MFKQARVVGTHPDQRRIDVVTLDRGIRINGVQVAVGACSSDSGVWNMPDTSGVSAAAAAGLSTDGTRNVVALIAPMDGGGWVAMGFTYPNGGQLSFTEQNRHLDRHPTGAYTTVAPDGSIEIWHPSGAYLRIGTGAHQPLASVTGPEWVEPAKATDPTFTIATDQWSLVVQPNGAGLLTMPQGLTIDANVTINGNLAVDGNGSPGTIAATGNINSSETVTGSTDVVGGGKSLKGHVHTGVQSGDQDSGPPA